MPNYFGHCGIGNGSMLGTIHVQRDTQHEAFAEIERQSHFLQSLDSEHQQWNGAGCMLEVIMVQVLQNMYSVVQN
jgi:hypothetical protein